jgi:hypothetical protein
MASRAVTANNLLDACIGVVGMNIGQHDCTLTAYIEIYTSGREPLPKIADYERAIDDVTVGIADGRRETLRTIIDQIGRDRATS